MKKNENGNKINIKKSLIVFPIVIALVGTTLIGAFATVFTGGGNDTVEEQSVVGENLEDVINDEKAMKIIDIHENLPEYIDKDVVLEGYFIEYDENHSVFGVEIPLGDGQMTMASLSYEPDDKEMLKDITDTDLVKASGTITSFEELHEDDENGDHTHTQPMFNVGNIEIIR